MTPDTLSPCDLTAKDLLCCLVGFDDGAVEPRYCIEYEAKVWCVTAWWIERTTDIARPERMLRVDGPEATLHLCEPGGPWKYAGVLLPRAAVDDVDPHIPGVEVRNLPARPTIHRRDLKTLPTLLGEVES